MSNLKKLQTGNPPDDDRVAASTLDKLFDDSQAILSDFAFDEPTVSVFDDMVGRSVPFYEEMQRMTDEIAQDFAVSGSNVFDLGCSTATTLLRLDQVLPPDVRFVGVDNSVQMLNKARQKVKSHSRIHHFDFIEADLHHDAVVEDASVVIMILSLQFMRPLYREQVMRRIFDGMRDNAALILIEKLTVGDGLLNRLYIKYYYEMKRRKGYSELEISKKREALENVLIPYQWDENRDLLTWAGFRHVETFFRWYNFAGMLAVK